MVEVHVELNAFAEGLRGFAEASEEITEAERENHVPALAIVDGNALALAVFPERDAATIGELRKGKNSAAADLSTFRISVGPDLPTRSASGRGFLKKDIVLKP